jgi:2-hydroxychromene-2-carboxylate isomerase
VSEPDRPTDAGSAEFWFDPTCPYTWRTSRWLVDMAARQGLSVTWHVMSLGLLHHGDVAGKNGAVTEGTIALRALLAAEDAGGQEGLARLYMLLGTRKHDSGLTLSPESVRQAVHDAGLPAEVGQAVDDDSYDSRIAESHERGQARGGMEMGSPVLAFDDGRGYFGPVISALPVGEEAVRLFDAVRLLASVPVFCEFKTSKS